MLARSLILSLTWIAGTPGARASQPFPGCQPPWTVLVLSGGGAAGLAHVGVIRALEEAGIRPDLIVGSSMGAVVGAMHASGYTGAELDSMLRALPLHQLFGVGNPLPLPLGEWPRLLVLRRGPKGLVPQLPFVNEHELNPLLSELMLRGNLQALGDFDALPIPFRAVATDLARRKPVSLGSGDLALAVRASLSLPIIFPPVQIDGRWIGDGALTANVRSTSPGAIPSPCDGSVPRCWSSARTRATMGSGSIPARTAAVSCSSRQRCRRPGSSPWPARSGTTSWASGPGPGSPIAVCSTGASR